jgi:hypothetical protein
LETRRKSGCGSDQRIGAKSRALVPNFTFKADRGRQQECSTKLKELLESLALRCKNSHEDILVRRQSDGAQFIPGINLPEASFHLGGREEGRMGTR